MTIISLVTRFGSRFCEVTTAAICNGPHSSPDGAARQPNCLVSPDFSSPRSTVASPSTSSMPAGSFKVQVVPRESKPPLFST